MPQAKSRQHRVLTHGQSTYSQTTIDLKDQIINRHIDLADSTINVSSWQAWACIKVFGGHGTRGIVCRHAMKREAVLRLGAEMQSQNDMTCGRPAWRVLLEGVQNSPFVDHKP